MMPVKWSRNQVRVRNSKTMSSCTLNATNLFHAALDTGLNVAAAERSHFAELLRNLNAVTQQDGELAVVGMTTSVRHQLKYICNSTRLHHAAMFLHVTVSYDMISCYMVQGHCHLLLSTTTTVLLLLLLDLHSTNMSCKL